MRKRPAASVLVVICPWGNAVAVKRQPATGFSVSSSMTIPRSACGSLMTITSRVVSCAGPVRIDCGCTTHRCRRRRQPRTRARAVSRRRTRRCGSGHGTGRESQHVAVDRLHAVVDDASAHRVATRSAMSPRSCGRVSSKSMFSSPFSVAQGVSGFSWSCSSTRGSRIVKVPSAASHGGGGRLPGESRVDQFAVQRAERHTEAGVGDGVLGFVDAAADDGGVSVRRCWRDWGRADRSGAARLPSARDRCRAACVPELVGGVCRVARYRGWRRVDEEDHPRVAPRSRTTIGRRKRT